MTLCKISVYFEEWYLFDVPDNTPIPGLQVNLLESSSSFVIPRKKNKKHGINKSTKRSNK